MYKHTLFLYFPYFFPFFVETKQKTKLVDKKKSIKTRLTQNRKQKTPNTQATGEKSDRITWSPFPFRWDTWIRNLSFA